jgi:hypothetical protein
MTVNVVTTALQLELGRVRSKLEGARSRQMHAERQAEIESQMVTELENDAAKLVRAICDYGGDPNHEPHTAAAQATRAAIEAETTGIEAASPEAVRAELEAQPPGK